MKKLGEVFCHRFETYLQVCFKNTFLLATHPFMQGRLACHRLLCPRRKEITNKRNLQEDSHSHDDDA